MTDSTPIPGLCSVTFRKLDPDSVLELAAKNGVEAIEWGADIHLPPGDFERAQQIANRSSQLGIEPASYGSYFRAGVSGADDSVETLVETATSLGASHLRVWAGDVSGRNASSELWEGAARDLYKIAEAAEQRSIAVSAEFHRNTLTETADDAAKLMEMVDHPNLFSLWQPVPGRGREKWCSEIALLGPWLSHFHVFHWLPDTPRDQRRPLSEGEGDWQNLMAHWDQSPRWAGRKIAFLEFVADDLEENFADDMKVLNRLCSAFNEED